MYHNIPAELKALRQWVTVGPNREPLNPHTGNMALVNDPTTWAAFDEIDSENMVLGFVITDSDPYCFIDLDDKEDNPATPEQKARHARILEAFDSYTERSISGRGFHIIIRGAIPTGARRDNVEIYSNLRYMIMTGDVVKNKSIQEYHNQVNLLYKEMKPNVVVGEIKDGEATMTDEQVISMACDAINGEKFKQLCRGEIHGYPSQSEADLALLSMLCFYSRNNEQVQRIFCRTELGKRPKSQRTMHYAIRRIRSNEPPEINMEEFKQNLEKIKEVEPEHFELHQPPGLLGDLTNYFYQTAVRPVPEVALAGAISLLAGVAGRSYNISGTGLNQYIILLAGTGSGKDGAITGIEKLIAATRVQVPMVEQFIGPANFASGQAIVRVLNERPCFVSVLGEFGITLQQICDRRANSGEKTMKRVMLDVYTKSGWNRTLRSSAYSDIEKNTKIIRAPSLTILGESTPETFFDGLDFSHITEGLIPRFTIMQYKGPRPARNLDCGFAPPDTLVKLFTDLVVTSQSIIANNSVVNVSLSKEAKEAMNEFDKEADRHINEGKEVEKQIWNRAHLKALKLAALIAVGCELHNPVINLEIANWVIKFIKSDVQILINRFEAGDYGFSDNKQLVDVRCALNKLKGLDGIIKYRDISRITLNLTSLRNDRLGATNALKRVLQILVDSGEIVEIPKEKLVELKIRGRAFGMY